MGDDFSKWLEWVWVPATALVIGFVRYTVKWFKDTRDEFLKGDANLEAIMTARIVACEKALAQSTHQTQQNLKELLELSRAIQSDLDKYKLQSEQRFSTKDESLATEQRLEKAIDRLIEVLRQLDPR